MIQVNQLRKDYGAATVLADISFIINDGEHIGLIGPNGSGKSTLLRCLVGVERPDGGAITLSPPDATIGYLPQAVAEVARGTVADALEAAQADYVAAERELQTAAELLAGPDAAAAMAAYDSALARFEALGGYEREHRAAAVMQGLGLADIDPSTPVALLSGGQKTRLGLATLLLRQPLLLLLDEPTNHLDVAALEWLESFVQRYPGAVLVVSHDRAFLDRTVTRILYLDPDTRTLRSYAGNYSEFAAARAHEHELHVEAWKHQQEYIAQVRSDIARLRAQALDVELASTPKDPDSKFFLSGKGGSKKVARKARARERKLERFLESDERVEKPRRRWGLKLDFGAPPPGGRAVLRVEDLSFSYQPSAREAADAASPSPLLAGVTFEVGYGERVAIVGPNGAGKTTLLRLIDGRLHATGGTVTLGANVRVGTLAQEQETLDMERTVLETVRLARPMTETDARNFLHFFLFGGDSVFRPVGACSLGERARLQLAVLVLQGCNLLLLDEPLNHLDIEGRQHFQEALEAFEGTVIAVAHDRAFLHAFAERVIEVEGGRVRSFPGEYGHYIDKTRATCTDSGDQSL